ncbi:hypothetical protein EIP91_003183 [Steccherinum ochraceum]|uniref:Uncharacterized protein n=1 Tax=Steccherinum ochraceum TaxID=92696 RepID=A0A4R0RSB9_9APHY|nr:hypothetical protein EIP91_003183 [Steccherinum ochraceum]
MADSEVPAKQPRWVWHTSAGAIHHPDMRCTECNVRQLHVSNAEALDDDFKDIVTSKRVDRKEMDKLRRQLSERDAEIAKIRVEVTELNVQVAELTEKVSECERVHAPTPLAVPSSPSLPSPTFLSARNSPLPAMDDEPHPTPSFETASLNAAGTSQDVSVKDAASQASDPKGSKPHPQPSRRKRGPSNQKDSRHHGLNRAGQRHIFRREIGSLMSADDFSRTNPADFQRLPPIYRRARIFAAEDVEDLFDRQSHPNNSASKKACSLLDHLHDASTSKNARLRAPVEAHLMKHYKTNRKHSEWYRAR